MTHPEDVLKAAREAAAKYWEADAVKYDEAELHVIAGYQRERAQMCRYGQNDDNPIVEVACIAIMAERQRCAGIAQAHLDRLPNYSASGENGLQDKVEEGYGNAALNIKAAILGQQETGGRRQRAGE